MIYSRNLSKKIAALTPVPGSEEGDRRLVLLAIKRLGEAGEKVTRSLLIKETGLNRETVVAILALGVQKGVITEILGRKFFGNPIYYYGLGKTAEQRAEEAKKQAEQAARVRRKLEQEIPHVPDPTPAEVKAFTERIERINAGQPEETLDEFLAGIGMRSIPTPDEVRAHQAEIERIKRRETDLQEKQRREDELEQSRRKLLPQALLDDTYGDERQDEWDEAIDRLLEELEAQARQRRLDDGSTSET